MPGSQSHRWSLRSTFDFEFGCFNQRRRTRQHSTASELQIGRGMTRAINSARLALFIHKITSAKRTREVRPALILVGESSTQLLMYSLDMYVCKLIYDSVDFQVSEVFCKGSEF